jgi:hypothetical protein
MLGKGDRKSNRAGKYKKFAEGTGFHALSLTSKKRAPGWDSAHEFGNNPGRFAA